jgi:hypothetical protein
LNRFGLLGVNPEGRFPVVVSQRNEHGEVCRLHAGNRPNALKQLLKANANARAGFVSGRRKPNLERNQVLSIETGIGLPQVADCAKQQAGAYQ